MIGVLYIAPVRSYAISQSIAIRSVLAADTLDTNDELIELENVSDQAVDITNWSIMYIASTNSVSSLRSIKTQTLGAHIMLPAHTRETLFSTKYVSLHPTATAYLGAETFTGKMSYTTAGLELRDDSDQVVDSIRWGSWPAAVDTSPAPSMTTTTLLQRSTSDTDNNRNDFTLTSQTGQIFTYGHLYEVVDQCANLDGIQAQLPPDTVKSGNGDCVSADLCPSLSGIQYDIPAGFEVYLGQCVPVFVPAALFITELLPNPSGIDAGHEYIELYNDTDNEVVLADYYLTVADKHLTFPGDAKIAPHAYRTFSDAELGAVFGNTKGYAVSLIARNEHIVDTMPAYANAPIDDTWALINDTWQYTNQPTPNLTNLASLLDDGALPSPDAAIVACADGYYRNPDTNRCRKIQIDEVPTACKPNQYRSEETGRCRNYVTVATPALCKEGQYRSEETGRCRSIALTAAASLKPCDDDQFRNPATGRCKQIASADDLPKPCASGYERNAETNRCRKIQTSSMPVAAFPVEPVAPTVNTVGIWTAIGAVIGGGVAYAMWEWRKEATGLLQRFRQIGRK